MHKKVDIYANLCQLPLFGRSKVELLGQIAHQLLNSKKTSYIVTPNPEQLVLANRNESFNQAVRQADIFLPDGTGLVAARKILSWLGKAEAVTERIAGADVVTALLELAQTQKYRVLVIGGRGYEEFLAQYPAAFEWTRAYQAVAQPTAAEETALQTALVTLKPEIVLVALGAPWQEQWVADHRVWLEAAGVKVVMVVGGALDFVTGKVKRAPQALRALGLEWLYRLVQEPWRWRRQLKLIEFVGLVVGAALFAPRLSHHSATPLH